MKIATIRLGAHTRAVRVDTDAHVAITIDDQPDVGTLLNDPDWKIIADHASGETFSLDELDYSAVVPRPGKIFCVGLNYTTHITEMGRELPQYPTLFLKVADALTGPYDDVIVPEYASHQLDWEAELAVIIGSPAHRIAAYQAHEYIAGYSVINDYTMRDYQYRSLQWDQGKNFERTSGFGPWLDTDYQLGTVIETRLDGEVVQHATTDDLVFPPAALVEYISHIVTLNPGDVIITGTTGGVGHARKPARYIGDGQVVEVEIAGLGTVRNRTLIK
ncbi:MAG: fumarylacetoacetate hydrolase family protein [Gordonia sp. (in: high G+C Gram-positive bacteria)]